MKKTERFYSLDALKILATIFIIFHHYQQITGLFLKKGINFYGGKFYFGYVVELFFILSGLFLIKYIDKIKNGLSFKNFYLKRFLRFFPLLSLSAITYETAIIIYRFIFKENWLNKSATFFGTIADMFGIQHGWVIKDCYVNFPTWYISVLLLCYILFYIIVYLSKRLKFNENYIFIFMILFGIGIITYKLEIPFFNSSTARGIYSFFTGIILGLLLKKFKITNKVSWISFITISILTLLMIFKPRFMKFGINYTMNFIYYPALIILFSSNKFKKVFSSNKISLISKISFDVYIWHNVFFPIMYIIVKLLHLKIRIASLKSMIVYTIFCFIIGTLSYHFIEKPTSKFIDKKTAKFIN